MNECCLLCMKPLGPRARGEYHPSCMRKLFGTTRIPFVDVDPATLYLFGQAMAGKITLSGVQKKIALGWADRQTLRVVAEHSPFILKPTADTYPDLPANEHLTMRLAARAGLETASTGLVRLKDGSLALLVRRFDRTPENRRVPMEDFCQLNGLYSADKYSGTAELCVRTVRRFSAEPPVDLLRLFRQFLFSWWVGNGDLHLKNLALLTLEPAAPRLSPAYDLLSTFIVIVGDTLAMSVEGKKSNLSRKTWNHFGDYAGLAPRVVDGELQRIITLLPVALEEVERSFLRPDLRAKLSSLLTERTAVLAP